MKMKNRSTSCILMFILKCRKYVSSFRPSRLGTLGSFLDLSGIMSVFLAYACMEAGIHLSTCIFLHLNGK
jgi:hypothetical protein